jgi:hypothetical protein
MPVVQVEHYPQAAADHHQNREPGEAQRHEVFPRRPFEVYVEEVVELDDDLDDRRKRNHRKRGARRQQCPIDGRKRDHGQRERQSEADQIPAPVCGRRQGGVAHDNKTPGR